MPLILILLLIACTHVHSAEPRALLDSESDAELQIKKHGDFSWHDTVSVFTLHADNRFTLRPRGISGRTISGWWRHDGIFFIIVGRWSWINGISSTTDYRCMLLDVRPDVTPDGEYVTTPYFQIEKIAPIDTMTYELWRQHFSANDTSRTPESP